MNLQHLQFLLSFHELRREILVAALRHILADRAQLIGIFCIGIADSTASQLSNIGFFVRFVEVVEKFGYFEGG